MYKKEYDKIIYLYLRWLVAKKSAKSSRVKKLFHVWKADPHAQLEKHNLQFDPILVHLHSYFGWHTIKLLCSWVGLLHKNFFWESHSNFASCKLKVYIGSSVLLLYMYVLLKDTDTGLFFEVILIRFISDFYHM